MKKFSLILLAGGIGTRMKKDIPKQHLLLHGKPIMMHIIERIDRIQEIDEMIITCPNDYVEETKNVINKYRIIKKFQIVDAGSTRQESVYKALKKAKNKHVIIHEAARPFVTVQEFKRIINDEHDNTIYGINIPFTVLKGNEYVTENLNRSELINIQLPQKFNTKELLSVHEKARKEKKLFTEDASLYYEYTNDKIKVLKGTEYNIKITNPIDLKIGEIIYRDYIIGEE